MTTPPAAPATKAKRTDDLGRAFAGSQLHMQVWVNARTDLFSTAPLNAFRLDTDPASVRWVSPRSDAGYREFRDGAFLRAIGQEQHRARLAAFWPRGGPVWDGLATVIGVGDAPSTVILVEGKSYPGEVRGRGCLATAGSRQRALIEASLDATAHWLGVTRPASWMGPLYQSANRLATVYFLREILGLNAFMANVCFTGDLARPTGSSAWETAHHTVRATLGLRDVPLQWLADVVLPAGSRAELLAHDPRP